MPPAAPRTLRPAAFAIPGDMHRRTGGFLYEKNLLLALRAQGREVAHVQLPAGFPDPDAGEMAQAVAQLTALPADRPVILDGLVYGAIDTAGLARVSAPLVAMIHHPLGLETGLAPARAAELRRREAANLALAAHVLVPSAHTARILAADFGVPAAAVTVAPPGFPPPDPRRDPATPPLVLAVGLMAPRKGHDLLIEALARVAGLPWQACIAGGIHDPAVPADLRARIRRHGLEDRVRLAGAVGEAELAALYRRAAVFALATRYEGYGIVFGEAMLHGLPIVATAGGAVADTVPAGAGLLSPVDDVAALAANLRRVLADEGLRARLAAGSAAAGARLPRWSDTAAIAGGVLDAL